MALPALAAANCGGSAPGAAGSGSRETPRTQMCTSLPGTSGLVPFSPYTDVTLRPQLSLTNTACSNGTRNFTIGFFQGPTTAAGCSANLAGVSYANPSLLSDVQTLRKLGGDAIGSFGGRAGRDLAQTCGNEAQLEAAYQSVVDYYGFRQIDFDIEGNESNRAAVNLLRSTALAALQQKEAAAGHAVKISLTLPVLPSGLPQVELDVVRSAVDAGVQLSIVNVLAMDYGDGVVPNPSGKMGNDAIDSATATEMQLGTIFPRSVPAQIWAMIGVTPMIGQNDTRDEVFTLSDAAQLASWASSQRIGRISMWSANRDVRCAAGVDQLSDACSGVPQAPWAYSKTFLAA